MGDTRRRWVWGAVLVLLAGLGVFLVSTMHKGGFDAEQWKAQRGSTARNNPRVGMVVELQEKHLRQGMTREEVRGLLGEPDSLQGSREVYELGASPFGASFEYFVIEYDSAGKVTQARVTRS